MEALIVLGFTDRPTLQEHFKSLFLFQELSRYIRRQKREKNEQISYMQIVVAAYVRAISRNPEVNRFIMNKQLFARNNCSAAFTILKDPSDADQGEAVVKIKFDLTDTIYDVRDRMSAAVAANRGDQPAGFVEKLLNFLFAVPGLATLVVGLVRLLDRYGLAPGILMEELPFYVGMYITNTASIGLHDVNHHIYNWGNVGLFFGMGLTEMPSARGRSSPSTAEWISASPSTISSSAPGKRISPGPEPDRPNRERSTS